MIFLFLVIFSKFQFYFRFIINFNLCYSSKENSKFDQKALLLMVCPKHFELGLFLYYLQVPAMLKYQSIYDHFQLKFIWLFETATLYLQLLHYMQYSKFKEFYPLFSWANFRKDFFSMEFVDFNLAFNWRILNLELNWKGLEIYCQRV